MANMLRASSVLLKSKTSSFNEPANDGGVHEHQFETALGIVDEETGERSSGVCSDEGHFVSEDRSQVFRNVM